MKRAFRLVLIVLFALCASRTTSAAPITKTFTDLNPLILGANVVMVDTDVAFEITNATGQLWTDFHLQVTRSPAGTAGLAAFGGSDPYAGPGTYTLSALNNPSNLPDIMDVVGLSVASGGKYSFTVDIVAGEAGWLMVGYPTVDGAPPSVVPEPTLTLLVWSGLLALAGMRRRSQQ